MASLQSIGVRDKEGTPWNNMNLKDNHINIRIILIAAVMSVTKDMITLTMDITTMDTAEINRDSL